MILKGKLEFISLFQTIKLFTDNGEINLLDYYQKLFERLNGKKVSQDYGMNSITITEDENSEFKLTFESKNSGTDDATLHITLDKINGFGSINIGSYLPEILERLNGMSVIINVQDNYISITNDPDENVYEIYYTGEGTSCKIPDDDIKSICKIGQEDCCIFITVGADGFCCEKFSSLSRTLLESYSQGTMKASRIGNCKIMCRKE